MVWAKADRSGKNWLFKMPDKKTIKAGAVLTVQQTKIVVGQPVKWVALIDRKSINGNQYLLNLPKNARKIKITSVTKQKAQEIYCRS